MILTLLIRYWYIFAIAGLLAALGTQHWYYKNKVDRLENDVVALTLNIKEANIKERALEKSAEELTKKYKESLHNQFVLQAEQGRQAVERIKKDEETKRIILSANAISLFNASKPSTTGEATTPAIKGNDGASGVPKPSGAAGVDSTTPTASLQDLLLVSAENDRQHYRCISQVLEWQHFWTEVEQSVKALETQ